MSADECWSDNVPRKLFRNYQTPKPVHEMSENAEEECFTTGSGAARGLGNYMAKLETERDTLRADLAASSRKRDDYKAQCEALRETVLSIGAQRDELKAKLETLARELNDIRAARDARTTPPQPPTLPTDPAR